VVAPAALRHPAVPQPDGTLVYELVTGHPDRQPRELVFLADLAVELRVTRVLGYRLAAMAQALQAHRDELLDLAVRNGGNTRGDAKFDVDGAIGTLAHYADLGAQLGSLRALRDGDAVQLGRTARYAGVHLWVPRDGVAVHINAFNFPAWG